MRGSECERHPPCPPEHVLEDFAVGRLEGARVEEIEAHIAACGSCAGTVQALRRDAEDLVAALTGTRGEAAGDCPAQTMLARFIDGSLAEGEREETEQHLAACGQCQSQVAEMLCELQILRGERPETLAPLPRKPAEIHEMPRSTAASDSDTERDDLSEIGRDEQSQKTPRESQG